MESPAYCMAMPAMTIPSITALTASGFDAIDYTFTPWMERGEMPWNSDGYKEYK